MSDQSLSRPWLATQIYRLYRDGFRQMTVGRTLWKIILIKLFIMFAVLKPFFFPNFLATQFATDAQRANYVIEQLTQSAPGSVQPVKGESP
ncbi:MAG: DUF4492 domain-containing protein [Desulfobulbus sp.]|nr:DUF4492 domain-containing protein [Desulfobulbus sp.]